MSKIVFILQRRQDMTRDQCVEYWEGPVHTSIVKKLPGLTEWVQKRVIGDSEEAACDGVGEMTFESDEAMKKAIGSEEMKAAIEDAKNFLDMDRTGMVVVREKTVVG